MEIQVIWEAHFVTQVAWDIAGAGWLFHVVTPGWGGVVTHQVSIQEGLAAPSHRSGTKLLGQGISTSQGVPIQRSDKNIC